MSIISNYIENIPTDLLNKETNNSYNSKIKEDKIYKSIEVLNQLLKSHYPYLTEILSLKACDKHIEDFINSKSDSLCIGILITDFSNIEKSLDRFCAEGSLYNQSFNIPLRLFYTSNGNTIFIKLKYDELLYAKPED